MIVKFIRMRWIVSLIVLSLLVACGGGGGGGSTATKPAAPAGVYATAGDGIMALGWNNSAGATSYNLYVATSSGVTPSTYSGLPNGAKHTGVSSPVTLTGLTNGTTYYVVVTAVNGAGESGESSEVSHAPAAGPGDAGNYFPMATGNTWTYSGTYSITGSSPVSNLAYTNVSSITGTASIGGTIATVWHDTNEYNSGATQDNYYVLDSNGLLYLGNNDATDVFTPQFAPYWLAKFPLTSSSGYTMIDKTGLDYGQDLDGDGINEKLGMYAYAFMYGTDPVTVPAGTYPNSVRIDLTATYTATYSKTGAKAYIYMTQHAWVVPGVGIVKISSTTVSGSVTETTTEELSSYTVH